MSNRQMHITEYLERKYAQQQSYYFSGLYHYKGVSYTNEEFMAKFGTKHIEKVVSIANKVTEKNPNPKCID